MRKKKIGRNKFEKRIYEELEDARVSFSYETARLGYTIEGNYIPDYVITTRTGTCYLETKGYFRPEAKRKMVAVKKCNPDLDIRIVFYSKNKTNIRWAEKNHFLYCFNTIPEEWIQEFKECGG